MQQSLITLTRSSVLQSDSPAKPQRSGDGVAAMTSREAQVPAVARRGRSCGSVRGAAGPSISGTTIAAHFRTMKGLARRL